MKLYKRLQLPGMMLVTLLTQFLGLYKSLVLGNIFGASVELDAYNFCNNITNFFLVFISAGVTTVVLPAYIKKQKRENIDAFLSLLFVIISFFLLILFVFRTSIIDFLTTKEGNFLEYTKWLMFYSIVTQTLPAILSVTTAFYQANSRFVIPKVILLISNSLVVCGLLAIKSITLKEYVNLLLVAALIQFALDVGIALKCGFRYKFNLDIFNSETKQLFKIFMPTVVSAGVFQIHSLIDTLVTASLTEGLLTIQSYAYYIVSVINGFAIVNLVTYIYPNLVEEIQKSKSDAQNLLWKYAKTFHWGVCAIVMLYVTVGHEGLRILFGNGKFTDENIRTLFLCAAIYLFGQQISVIRDLIYRFLYADSDTVTPLKNSVIVSVLNIILSFVLVKTIGFYGVALGNIICCVISLLMILLKIRNKYGFTSSFKSSMFCVLKNLLASILTVLCILMTKNMISLPNSFISILIWAPCTIVIYFGINFAMNNRDILDMFRNLVKKK